MMHHTVRPAHRALWTVVQLIAWVTVTAVLLLVTGCRSEEPAPGTTHPGPTFVRQPLHSLCGRCFERPELGHES